VYDNSQWKLWTVFGAHFHALRINALMVLGFEEVSLLELFKGARVNGCVEYVRLKPMYVIETDDKFNEGIGDCVGMKRYYDDKRNWRRDDWVVLNGESGKGFDIFYCLDKSKEDGQIVITDQRKRISGALGTSRVGSLVERARIKSSVVCLFSCFTTSGFGCGDIPHDCCVVSYSETRAYHGALRVHPAASPCVNLNVASISYLKMVFKGKDCDQFCKEILKKRVKRKFHSIVEVDELISANRQRWNIKIKKDDLERIVFS
jgi:hypothetical protein